MNIQDKYVVGIRDKYLCYFKNGELHREKGPAVFLITDKEKYFNLGDEKLYQTEILESKTPWAEIMSFMLKHTSGNDTSYYLNDVEYDKETWASLVEKKNLHNQLKNELPSTEIKNKKPKI